MAEIKVYFVDMNLKLGVSVAAESEDEAIHDLHDGIRDILPPDSVVEVFYSRAEPRL